MNVGEPKIPSRIMICQSLVIDPHQVEDCRVQIMHMNLIFDSRKSKLIGAAIRHPALDATSCEPDAKSMIVVITPF